jgi:hypothetical protein
MTNAELRELARHAARRTAPTEFSVANVDAAIADEFKKMTGSINNFMRNKYDIFDIIIENADDIVPAKVMDAMGQFAEVITIGNGDQKVFKRGGLGRNRAKKFLTQVGLNGLYETFRLDHETFTIGMKAIGGAVGIDFERMMDGAESLSEFMSVLAEAQEDAIYVEVQNALMAAADSTVMPAANKVAGGYKAEDLQRLVSIAKSYGGSATIFASPEFVAAMGPDAIVPPVGTTAGIYSPRDIEDIANTGRIRMFRGTPIVELRQSFLDENNAQVMINPQFAYVLPSGKEKIVKVLIEGATQMYDVVNPDQSIEIHTYKKIGVGILAFNNWCVYKNTGISVDNWYNPATLGIGGLGYTPYNND